MTSRITFEPIVVLWGLSYPYFYFLTISSGITSLGRPSEGVSPLFHIPEFHLPDMSCAQLEPRISPKGGNIRIGPAPCTISQKPERTASFKVQNVLIVTDIAN
jgi:hypothetical protein